MVKIASAALLVAAALVAGPVSVLASGWEDVAEFDSRALSTDTTTPYARETDELFARIADDLSLFELSERDLSLSELSERELDDLSLSLSAREPEDAELEALAARSKIGRFFKKIWHGIKKVASVVIRREDGDDELLARDELDIDIDDLLARTIADIDARSPGFAEFMKTGMTHVKHEAHAHPNAAHHVTHQVIHHAGSSIANSQQQQNQNNGRREYDEEDLYARVFDELEMEERELDELD